MNTLKKLFAIAVLAAATLTSCNTKKEVVYLQDTVVGVPQQILDEQPVKIEPGDKLSINVSSSDPELSIIFNLTEQRRAYGQRSGRSTGNVGSNVPLYTVDPNGYIDFPVLGPIYIKGLTRHEIATLIKDKLIKGAYIKDPVVTVEFANLHFTVIGDVRSGGVYSIDNDKINLLEALALAGDLNITGKRDGVYVIREVDGKRTTTKVDLRSADMFNSPVFYVKQNDIIYVEPNGKKTGESSVNANSWKSVAIYTSLASFLMTLTLFIVKW